MRWYVIGMGEVGRRVAAALERSGREVVPVTRDVGWAQAIADPEGARVLAVREEDLGDVLERLEGTAGERLVALQNGWIRPQLATYPGVSRGLVWFTAKGDFFRPLRATVFAGTLSSPLAEAFAAADIPAEIAQHGDFDRAEAEKMGFNCVVGLPLAVHGLSLDEYLRSRPDEARAVFREAVEITAAALGTEADPSWWNAFVAAVEPIGWVRPSRAKALDFRNRAVVRLAAELGGEAPVNAELLRAADLG